MASAAMRSEGTGTAATGSSRGQRRRAAEPAVRGTQGGADTRFPEGRPIRTPSNGPLQAPPLGDPVEPSPLPSPRPAPLPSPRPAPLPSPVPSARVFCPVCLCRSETTSLLRSAPMRGRRENVEDAPASTGVGDRS